MKIHQGTSPIPNLENAVVTSGTFDGVHLGHQKILERLRQAADQINGETVLLTYWPHPRLVLQPEKNNLKLLTTFDEKAELLEQFGIDHLVKIPFTKEFSEMSSEDYIRIVLHERVNAKKLIIGYDHHFGKNREGSLKDLLAHADKYDYQVEEIARQDIDEIGISSTKIRTALAGGHVAIANKYLGRPFSLEGIVSHGDKRGRTIGFPTANILVKEPYKLLPEDGIFAIRVFVNGQRFDGMLNIGNRPTVGGSTKTIEANIFDFDQDIYGQQIKIELIDQIRKEIKFDGLDQLKVQLSKDEIAVRTLLKQHHD